MSEPSTGNELVTYHREGYVGTLTLNRPDKRNALDFAVWLALDQAVSKAEEDREARVVLLRGRGVSFCAGLDLSPDNELFAVAAAEPSAAQKLEFYRIVRKAQAFHTRLERLTRPTIAVIQKHCLGAGLELALCCDMRLCTADTLFALPEAKLGFITDVGGLQRLVKVVGPAHAREISFRGHRFDAAKAVAIGLVNEVCTDVETLASRAEELADEIAGNPPLGVQGAKEVFLYDEQVSLEESLDYNAARSSMIIPNEDLQEAIAAYLEKRKGEFKGR